MFVIYKANNLPGVGQIHPQGIEIGLAYYKGWNLAKCPDELVHNYKEFDFISVTSSIASGLRILDSLIVEEGELVGMGAPENSQITIVLSDEDKLNKESAETFINNIELKLVTRAKVREIKDVEDDLVDLKRLVHSLLTFVVDDWRVKPAADKDKSKYASVMDQLTTAVANNINVLSTIEKDLDKIQEVVDLEVEIAKVVDEYYLTKKL